MDIFSGNNDVSEKKLSVVLSEIYYSMQFGHLKDNRGKVSAIDWTDLRLNGFEEGNIVLLNYKIAFTGF